MFLAFFIGINASGNSPEFTLQLYAPDKDLFSTYNIFVNESYVTIDKSLETCTGYIHQNGTLFLNGYAVGEGRDYLTTIPQSNTWEVTDSWTISNGLLTYHGNSTFYAVPSGSSGQYMFSVGDETIAYSITKIQVKPVLNDKSILETWPKKSGIRGGKLAAAIVVPIVGVFLILAGIYSWFVLRRRAMSPGNDIDLKTYPTRPV